MCTVTTQNFVHVGSCSLYIYEKHAVKHRMTQLRNRSDFRKMFIFCFAFCLLTLSALCALTPSVHFCHDTILLYLSAAFTFSFCGAWEALKALNATLMQNDMGAKTTIVIVCYHHPLHPACIRLISWCVALNLKFYCALPWLENPPKQQRRHEKPR